MTDAMLNRILGEAGAKPGKDDERELGEGSRLTLYVAHDGASLTVTRVAAVKIEGQVVVARNDKGERYFLQLEDIFAAGVDASPAQQSGRKAGFL
ncbi:MAG TPA: hypothetical protein VL400_09230 [Polyangiaceae bacterium]|jgi:hypothetical protein|nr:hypothetical protein [Polyangiaceae bacterium]